MGRHGSRWPLASELIYITNLTAKLSASSKYIANIDLPENLKFITSYQSTLGHDNLTAPGRQQLFNHGIEYVYCKYESLDVSLLSKFPTQVSGAESYVCSSWTSRPGRPCLSILRSLLMCLSYLRSSNQPNGLLLGTSAEIGRLYKLPFSPLSPKTWSPFLGSHPWTLVSIGSIHMVGMSVSPSMPRNEGFTHHFCRQSRPGERFTSLLSQNASIGLFLDSILQTTILTGRFMHALMTMQRMLYLHGATSLLRTNWPTSSKLLICHLNPSESPDSAIQIRAGYPHDWSFRIQPSQ